MYNYHDLPNIKTTSKTNFKKAIEILKSLNLSPVHSRKLKVPYLQTSIFFLDQNHKKIGFIQEGMKNKPAVLVTYK